MFLRIIALLVMLTVLFGVAAAEVTDEISAQITCIQGVTSDTAKALQGISQTIGKLNEINTTLAAAVEEKPAATKEVTSNINEVTKAIAEVGRSSTNVWRRQADWPRIRTSWNTKSQNFLQTSN